ncbi:MAG: hypothetical protein WAV50_02530 [Minisyncoccia bacterium]
MSLFPFVLFAPFIVALLPQFFLRDTEKPTTLVVIDRVILVSLLIIEATPLFPNILLSTLAIPLFLIPGAFILSFVGFFIEINDQHKRGHNLRNALWSTSFLSFVFIGILIVYLIVSLFSIPVPV